MPVIEGVVKAVSRKNRTTTWGDKVATNFLIDGEWYSGGFKSYSVNKGDTVQINYDQNGDFKNVKTLVVKSEGGGMESGVEPRASAGSSSNKFSGGRTFPVGALAPERTINRQNALTNAVAFVNGNGYDEEDDDNEKRALEVISIARLFEAYTTGDIDAIEARHDDQES